MPQSGSVTGRYDLKAAAIDFVQEKGVCGGYDY